MELRKQIELSRQLINAVKNYNLEEVISLIEQGADVDYAHSAALREASKLGHLEIVKYLIEKGASIEARDYEAIKNACIYGNLDVLEYFMGFKFNAWEVIPLYDISYKPYFSDVVRILLKHNKTLDYVKLISVSCYLGKKEILELLKEKLNKDNFLHYMELEEQNFLANAVESRNIEVVDFLINNGVRAFESQGKRALSVAVKKWHRDIIKLLISKGASKFAKEMEILIDAVNHDDLDMVKFLLDRPSTYSTATFNYLLNEARKKGYNEIADLLEDYK